jgi:penicillin-binding protein 1B
MPAGVSVVRLDKVTNLLADATCPSDYDAAFLDGTAPTETCSQSAGDQRNVFQKLFGLGKQPTVTAPGQPVNGLQPLPPNAANPQTTAAAQPSQEQPQPDQQPKKKRGFFGRLFGGKGDDKQQPPPPDNAQPH